MRYLRLSGAAWTAALVSTMLVCAGCAAENAATGNPDGFGLCQVRLVGEAEPDTTSVDTILAAITKPGMSDEEKCMAVYRYVYEHRFWYPAATPRECGRYVNDPVLMINGYPAMICQADSAITSALWAGLGYDVRYWQLGGHTTGEVFYEGKWHNFDATLGRYKRDADGSIGGVEVSQRQFKKESYVPPVDDYEIGHRMDWSLRRGETFTRCWYPLGKTKEYWRPGGRNGIMPDERPGHNRGLQAIMKEKPYRIETDGMGITHGEWIFEPELARADWKLAFWQVENVAVDAQTRRLHPEAAGKPAVFVWRMRTPWTITGAWMEGDFAGTARVAISTNNGSTWDDLDAVKTGAQKLDMSAQAGGHLTYLVRISMQGADAGVRALRFRTVVQVNPLALPALKHGDNRMRLFAGEQVETILINPDLSTSDYRKAIVSETNIQTAREQMQEGWVNGLCAAEPEKPCEIVYKVTAPGEIRQVRWGGRFLKGDGIFNEMLYSTDGKNWKPQKWTYRWTKIDSPVPNHCVAIDETTTDVTGDTVWLKYRCQRPTPKKDRSGLLLFSALHMNVDFAPAAPAGAVPVEVAYCWAETLDGKDVEKTHTELARKLPHEWNIAVDGDDKPLMKWVRMRLTTDK